MSSSKIIGIAGGIGSGKSTVTDYLQKKGYPVYDGDVEAREAVKKGQPALNLLMKTFGREIIGENGELNRRLLAKIAFASPEKTAKLNKILHEDIASRISLKIKEDGAPISFISAPLFFEAGLDKKCDETWSVVADKQLRVKRTMERDGLSKEEVEDRMKRQMSDAERIRLSDHIIVNEEGEDELIEQVDQLLDSL